MKPHHYQVLIASCVAVTLGLLWTGTSQPGSTLAPGLYPSARHTPPEPFAEDSGRGSPQATTRPTAVACESTGFTGYETLPAYQWDQDNPVRPAWYHADKNLALRGYAPAPGSDLLRLVDYGTDDPTQPPQLATLFDPPRVPVFVGAYRVGGWDWRSSPAAGRNASPLVDPPVTALGLQTTPCELVRVPASGYEIGGPAGQEFEALVLFADRDSLLLKYTREDSVAPNGYALHLDGLSVDPSLLALYQALDQGPRYAYCGGQRNCSYELVGLRAGDPIGRAQGAEVIVATVDSGAFVDPRSCNDWWQIRLDQDCP